MLSGKPAFFGKFKANRPPSLNASMVAGTREHDADEIKMRLNSERLRGKIREA
jgi:hypothetical protein